MSFKLKSFYKLVAVNTKTKKRRVLTDWFPNIILNQGLNFIGSENTWFNYLHVGLSNEEPQATQNGLVSWLKSSGTSVEESYGAASEPPYYGWKRKVFRVTQIENQNINEIGIGYSTSSGSLCTRSLIRNINGDVTTVTLLPDEFLEVTAEVRHYIPEEDVVGTVNISGEDYNYIVRAADATSGFYWGRNIGTKPRFFNTSSYYWKYYNDDIGIVTGRPSGSSTTNNNQPTNGSYSNNSYQIFTNLIAEGPEGNFTSGKFLRSFWFYNYGGAFQMQLSKVSNPLEGIVKTSSDYLVLNIVNSWAEKTF